MAKNPGRTKHQGKAKELRVSFSNYENAVTLISSLEAWCHHRWGEDGKEDPGLLEFFDRFPTLGALTPDFLVKFKTPYLLCGEHMRNFRSGSNGKDDIDQVFAYARWTPPASDDGKPVGFDVLVLVNSENDDVAASELASAAQKLDPASKPIAPIVVIGSYLDRESINGEWYKLKWRSPNNQRFSHPNVSSDAKVQDLNALLVGKSGLHAIPVSRPVADIAGRNPLINDAPPPFYTAVRLVLPALNQLLTDADRDALVNGKIEKRVTRDDILQTRIIADMKPQPKHIAGSIQAALDFLVFDLKIASRVAETDPVQYAVTLDRRVLRDPMEAWSEKVARLATKRLGPGKRKASRSSKDSLRNQPKLPFND